MKLLKIFSVFIALIPGEYKKIKATAAILYFIALMYYLIRLIFE